MVRYSLCSKKLADVRHGELLEGVSAPLLQLAGRKAVEWAQSKPHAPLLLQIAASLPGKAGQGSAKYGNWVHFDSAYLRSLSLPPSRRPGDHPPSPGGAPLPALHTH